VERSMSEIRAILATLDAPSPADPTWQRCMSELGRFEQDLERHVHLENFVLFPRALELERLLG